MLTLDPKACLKNIPHQPGVYQMFNAAHEVLYVGKAKNLKKRVASYFRVAGQNPRTLSFLAQVVDIAIIITTDESAALLLEYSLIKSLKPRYNILFKDDKSYPYLFLSQHPYPALSIYRGMPTKEEGLYFGPFPNGHVVREILLFLQKIFKLRQCSNNVFKSRSRPCLQYQIGRCSAPCCPAQSQIDAAEYAHQVDFAKMFLAGKSNTVVDNITRLMQNAAQRLEFEKAAYYREQITKLKEIQKQQAIIQQRGDIDVIATVVAAGHTCVDVLLVRHGMVLGNKIFQDECLDSDTPREMLSTFIMQYYSHQATLNLSLSQLPQRILINISLNVDEKATLEKGLNQAVIEAQVNTTVNAPANAMLSKIKILSPSGAGAKNYKEWLNLATTNAQHKLQQKLMQISNFTLRFKELQEALSLTAAPQHIECFDVSHHGGEATIVSCVAFSKQGAQKNNYRRYNIKTATAGDDYGALREALERRFAAHARAADVNVETTEHTAATASVATTATTAYANNVSDINDISKIPDVVIIDGGKGQLKVAQEILSKLHRENIAILAIAKGKERKVGNEKIYLAQYRAQYRNTPNESFADEINDIELSSANKWKSEKLLQIAAPQLLSLNKDLFLFLLHIRDTAHHFAITAQRNKLSNRRITSPLENIPGIGKKRRAALLQHCGGWQGVKAASVAELSAAPGIPKALAQQIYDALHKSPQFEQVPCLYTSCGHNLRFFIEGNG